MYVKEEDVEMRQYINSQMWILLRQCIQYSDGQFDPSETNRRSDDYLNTSTINNSIPCVSTTTNNNSPIYFTNTPFDSINDGLLESNDHDLLDGIQEIQNDNSISQNDVQNNVISTFPATDSRRRDVRIKFGHEH